MSLADKIAHEMEIKMDLMIEGIHIEESALEGVGTKYCEKIIFLFDYTRYGLKGGTIIPSEMMLPEGTCYMVMYDTRSPYLVRKEENTLILEKNGKFVSTVRWNERPEYYNQKTSYGTEMRKIAQFRGDCGIIACISNFCSNWKTGDQCLYCNFDLAQKSTATTAAVKETLYDTKSAREVGEVIAAAIEEGIRPCFITSSGDLPGRGVTDSTTRIIQAVKKATHRDTMIGCVNLAAPDNLEDIDRLYQAGARNIAMNMEIWNPDMFKAICPGKAKRVGQEHWKRALEYAVSVFGRGNVISGLVVGLEPKENYYEAAHWMSEKGIYLVDNCFRPDAGSKLENHRPPRPEWFLEVMEKSYDIAARNLPEMFTREYSNNDKVGCYRCAGSNLCWDELRRRLDDFRKVMPKDQPRAKVTA